MTTVRLTEFLRFLRMLLVVAAVLAAVPTSAWALDAHKTAEALAARAAKAFESGDMSGAAASYREAFKIDNSEPAYLYAAARAAHAARDLTHAEADYVAFLALASTDAARVHRAESDLVAVRTERSEAVVMRAEQAEAAGDALLAATLYADAFGVSNHQAEPLLKAAILERQLHDTTGAMRHLKQYLAFAPADASGRRMADALLRQLAEPALPPPAAQPPARTAATTAAVPVAVTKAPTAPASSLASVSPPVRGAAPPVAEVSGAHARRVVGWSVLVVGCLGVLAGGGLAYWADNQQTDLNRFKLPTGNFDGRLISVDDAVAKQAAVNSYWTAAAVAGGVGVVAIVVGAILLPSSHAEVAIAPSWDRLTIVGRF